MGFPPSGGGTFQAAGKGVSPSLGVEGPGQRRAGWDPRTRMGWGRVERVWMSRRELEFLLGEEFGLREAMSPQKF